MEKYLFFAMASTRLVIAPAKTLKLPSRLER